MLKTTPLNAIHHELGGHMSNVHGWDMPLYYKSGAETERTFVLQKCGLFDACHMGAIRVMGMEAPDLLKKSLESGSNFECLKKGLSCRGTLKAEQGCAADECVIYQMDDEGRDYMMTVEPNRTFYVVDHLERHKPRRQRPERYQDPLQANVVNEEGIFGHIELLGPKSDVVLRSAMLRPELLDKLPVPAKTGEGHFIGTPTGSEVFLRGNIPVMISRTDCVGFEVFCPVEKITNMWEALLKAGGEDILPCGMAARPEGNGGTGNA